MPVQLYEHPGSYTGTAIKIVAKRVGVEINAHGVDLTNGEQLKPDFLKINPFHTVPAIVDDGFTLFETKAIMAYLVNKYAPESDLYPKDAQKRAAVDAILHYDNGTLVPSIIGRVHSLKRQGKDLPEDHLERGRDHLKCLDNVLSTQKYLAGDHLTIADIGVVHTLVLIEALDKSLKNFEHLNEYYQRVGEQLGSDFVELNAETLKKIEEFLHSHKSH